MSEFGTAVRQSKAVSDEEARNRLHQVYTLLLDLAQKRTAAPDTAAKPASETAETDASIIEGAPNQ